MNAHPGFVRDYDELTDVRAREPQRIFELFGLRTRRSIAGAGRQLMIIACDHPARGALSVRGKPAAMADRWDLLERLTTALGRPGVDGVLATPDIVEDLLLLGALEDKLVFGSLNRGGLAGSAFELDDRHTAYDVPGVVDSGLDGGKMLLRIDLDDPGTVATMQTCGASVSQLARAGRVAMVEPFMSRRVDRGIVNDLRADEVALSVNIAQGLGATSAYTWLKLPVVDDMARVMRATTLPTLLLGGDPNGDPDSTYAQWAAALALPSVRGLVVGRALLYPADDDVSKAVDTAVSLVR
ncbi:deoxyribose-phosphate aldolase [Nocardioidaceae bacterium SCSIO 66511]|nr:deoxyribose-phosphate aldolase [Nocardioidaceae bacterium SCSIO 66511]